MGRHSLKALALIALACSGFAISQIATAANGCRGGQSHCPKTVSTPTTTTTTNTTTTTATTATALRYRYTYNNGTAAPTTASYGWNLADVGGKSAADALPAGMQGLVWVGDYDNSTCSWQVSDATLTTKVQSMVGDAHVFGYFISDEPYTSSCPNAPAQHAARNALIKSIDRTKTTVMLLNSTGDNVRSQFPLWSTPADADVIGIDPYPCLVGKPCDWTIVAKSIQAADAAGFRYWFAVQSFANYEYRFPTASELQYLLGLMSQSHADGLMTFAWTYSGYCLCDHPDLLAAWDAYNHS